ncbi:MAG: hypothetical protein EA377_08000 [Phycisphaerales bacterium]|nr:MAG: hypothetical protein EA377_08000 [Phycisphaerales bacterium]
MRSILKWIARSSLHRIQTEPIGIDSAAVILRAVDHGPSCRAIESPELLAEAARRRGGVPQLNERLRSFHRSAAVIFCVVSIDCVGELLNARLMNGSRIGFAASG